MMTNQQSDSFLIHAIACDFFQFTYGYGQALLASSVLKYIGRNKVGGEEYSINNIFAHICADFIELKF